MDLNSAYGLMKISVFIYLRNLGRSTQHTMYEAQSMPNIFIYFFHVVTLTLAPTNNPFVSWP